MKNFIQLFTFAVASLFSATLFAQAFTNPAPLEIIAPDARSAGIADIGSATTPDAYSQHWNVAKYAFAPGNGAAAFAYTPWMRRVTNDMNLFYISGFHKIGQQAISASLRYLSIGNIPFTDESGNNYRSVDPAQYSFDVGYSRTLGNYFSLGLAFRYLSVFQTERTGETFAMTNTGAFAADLGMYFRYPSGKSNEFAMGLSFKNIGTKVNWADHKIFLPMSMNLGSRYSVAINPKNSLDFAIEISKPLVPKDQSKSVAAGFFSAFGNNIQEWGLSFGTEYDYARMLLLRVGYHFGSNNWEYAAGSYLSAGAGVCWQDFTLDLSYMVSTQGNAALTNTVRISLAYVFGAPKK